MSWKQDSRGGIGALGKVRVKKGSLLVDDKRLN